jgi:hypothetical protein
MLEFRKPEPIGVAPMKWLLFFVGYVAGFATLFVLMLIFGDYSDTPAAPVVAQAAPVAAVAPVAVASSPTAIPVADAPLPTSAPVIAQPQTGPTYEQVCKADTANMTDPQIAAFGQKSLGLRFTGWRGWVYNVESRFDGKYNLQIAMEERGLFWGSDITIEDIPSDLALRLNVEQRIALSGLISRVDTTFNVICNPLVVTEYTINEHP